MLFVQKNPSVVLSKLQRILMTGVSMGALCFIATPEPVFAQSFPQSINPVPSPVLSDLVSKGGVVTHKPRPVDGANGKDAHIKIGLPPKRVEATAGSSGKDGDSFTVSSGSGHSATGSNIFLAGSIGGAGGNGGAAGRGMKGNAAAGGDGGNGGNVGVGSIGDLTVQNGSGIVAFSTGGRGGHGGDGSALIDSIKSGAGGNGGNAGQVSVTNSGQIVVTGDQSFGIIAQAVGGHGGKAGDADGDFAKALAAKSGDGGRGGTVVINNKNNITTVGAGSDAIHGLSLGGKGGDAAEAKSLTGSATNGVAGNGGNAGAVTITSDKIVSTQGAQSNGLVGKSVGGKGGNGNNVTPGGSVDTTTAGGGHGGNGGGVDVTNDGFVTITNGHAIYAESTGGAGGASGSSVAALSKTKSGNGGNGGNAGAVNVNNSGVVTTKTDSSSAIVAVSAGGQGGSANDAGSSLQAKAGSGGNGGDGGKVIVTNVSSVRTQGDASNGIIAASVGGAGGHGGWAASVLDATSGDGGQGGNGAEVDVTNNSIVKTLGDNSAAVVVSSAGGNGGKGGRSVGGADAASGSGGVGGNAGAVSVTNSGSLNTEGVVSSAVVATSDGGSGGRGGASIGIHTSAEGGGAGGKSDRVTVVNDGTISTTQSSSLGIFARSNGGQGGAGGLQVSVASNGGHGGKGGAAGAVSVTNNGTIETGLAAKDTSSANVTGSAAIVAQSVGGAGGNSGANITAAPFLSGSAGGTGGEGGNAGAVDVTTGADSSITTYGDSSAAIIAQSVGGAGGKGELVVSIAAGPVAGAATLGTIGGKGGDGATVTVNSGGTIATHGNGSIGVLASSVGGEGGTGGLALAGTESASVSGVAAVAREGGSGGNGSTVTIDNTALIGTKGEYASAVAAVSAGGKGGQGGWAGGLNTATILTASGAIAGNGGAGGDASDVVVHNAGALTTLGNGSAGIFAQSIGGQGAYGGSALTLDLGADADLAISAGGQGGTGGNAGQINIVNHGAITTSGAGSAAIFAESLGGHGGDGGLALGGSGGAGGNAADVTIENHAGLITTGDFSAAILAQSLGGKGGVAASGDLDETLAGTDGLNGDAGAVSINNSGDILTLGTRSDAIAVLSQDGAAAAVSVVNTGEIFTAGAKSSGISAQSLGEDSSGTISISNTGNVTVTGEGSGALVARSVVMRDDAPDAAPLMNMLSADMLPFDTPDFMMFTGNGAAGNVSINQTGNLIATGAGSSAIFAQSTGATNGNIDIVVQAESLLVGHSAGVTLIDGAENSLANHGIITGIGNTVGYIPGTDGQLLAAGWIDGMAVVGTTGNTAVTNTGLMVGNIDLGSGRNTFTNAQDAWLVSGSLIGLGGQTGSDFINDGILTPGGSTMTQTTQIDGNLNQTANGRYLVGLDFAGSTSANDPVMARMAAAQQSSSASGSADRLNVSGSANLGGSMALSVANSGYAKSGRNDYVALRAEGGVNDDGMLLVAPNTAVATYTLEYTDKETILGANIDYAARGLTENGIFVGTTINAIQTDQTSSAFRPLAEAIFAQPDIASLQRTYDLIDGEGTAGVQQAYFSETNAFIGAVSQQSNRWSNPYRQVGATVGQERDCIVNSNSCEESRWRGWYSGFGSDVSIDGDPYVVGSGDLSSQSKGMAAGFDYEINQNLLLGLAVGIGQTDFKVPDRLTQGDIRTGRTALYGAYKQNNFYVDGLVGVDWFDASTSRVAQIAATGSTAAFSDRLQNDFSGYGINARLETGYRTDLGGVQITPFAALQLSSFRMNGSTERADATSGDLALYYKDRTINSVPLSLGAQLDTQLELGKNAYFAPYIRAAWVHEFSNKRSVEAGFTAAPGYEFVVHGAAQARNSAQLEAGFNMQIETGLSLYGKVTGNFSGSAHDVSGSGGFRLRW